MKYTILWYAIVIVSSYIVQGLDWEQTEGIEVVSRTELEFSHSRVFCIRLLSMIGDVNSSRQISSSRYLETFLGISAVDAFFVD